MEMRQLRQFVALADLGNFHRAARSLHIAQPPLSVSIRKLEEELGCALFVRHSKGVTLTEAGGLALQEARSALAHADRMRALADAVTGGRVGRLRIGFVGSATYTLLPTLLPRFRQAFPQVALALEESTTVDILGRLDDRTLDVGLVRYPLMHGPARVLESLERIPFMVAVPASSPLARRRKLELAKLRDEPFIAHSAAGVPNLHAIFMLLCQEHGFVPNIVQEAVQVQTIVSLVESGLGIALVPASAARFANAGVRFVQLGRQLRSVETGLALATQEETSGALVRNFVKIARSARRAKPG